MFHCYFEKKLGNYGKAKGGKAKGDQAEADPFRKFCKDANERLILKKRELAEFMSRVDM